MKPMFFVFQKKKNCSIIKEMSEEKTMLRDPGSQM